MRLAFKCDICERGFTTKGNLISHIFSHETNQDKFSFKCEVCEARFRWIKSQKAHMLTHESTSNTDFWYDFVRENSEKKFESTHVDSWNYSWFDIAFQVWHM